MGWAFGVCALIATPAAAQLATPTIESVRPLALPPGRTSELEVRGANFDGSTSPRFDDPRIALAEPLKVEGGKVVARVNLPADIGPAAQRVRVVTSKGMSTAGRFAVGRPFPLVAEAEPNDGFLRAQPLAQPSAVAGVIEPADEVDVFAVEATAGETLVAEVLAARAGSGLDALVTIFTPEGRELAADDDGFGRDAVAWAYIPASGRYLVQVQDANGRLRDDKIEQGLRRPYVLNVGRFPVVTRAFPPGGRRGGSALLRIEGVNLPEGLDYRWNVPAESRPGDVALRIEAPLGPTNPVPLRIGEFPEWDEPELEPGDDPLHAPVVTVPAAINGRFRALDDGDLDLFRLRAEPGREGEYAITVLAARIGSAADPIVTARDEKGTVQAEDDDKLGRDARIERRIDAQDGLLISVRDYFRRGGPRFVYRIEVEPIARGVTVTADLGSRTLPRGGTLAIPLTIDRRGFEGPVTVLPGPLPSGLAAAPVTTGPKAKAALLILSATDEAPPGPFPLALTARDVPGETIFAFRECRQRGDDRGEAPDALVMVADPAPLRLAFLSPEILLPPGGQAEAKLRIDRRGDAAKKPVKLKILAVEGDLDGLDAPKELTVAADAVEAAVALKAKPDAAPRRVALAVRGWFEGGQEAAGIDGAGMVLVVPDRVK